MFTSYNLCNILKQTLKRIFYKEHFLNNYNHRLFCLNNIENCILVFFCAILNNLVIQIKSKKHLKKSGFICKKCKQSLNKFA